MRQMRDRLGAIPGVQQVTAARPFPLADVPATARWGAEAALTNPNALQPVDVQTVLPGYFETLRTPILAGRAFAETDNAAGPPVVIIDELLAVKAFSGQSAVGKRLLVRVRTPAPEWVEVVGVVAHQHTTSLSEPGREQLYVTDAFQGHGRPARWAIRVTGDPSSYGTAVRAALSGLNRTIAVTDVTPMQQLLDRTQAPRRFTLALLGSFAIVALLLSIVGLYGAVSTIVRQRTQEVGVRMAMGASPLNIRRMFVMHGVRLGAVGLGIGLAVALALTPVIKSLYFGVAPNDPTTFAAVCLVLVAMVILASWLPSSRATKIDPTTALRNS
jgi:putative ABC transport system permease protein